MPIDPQIDIETQIRKDASEVRVRANLFEPLISSDAWREFEKVARLAIDVRTRVVMGQTMTSDDVLQKEYIKGAAYGMELLLSLPSLIIAEKRILEQAEQDKINASRRTGLTRTDDVRLPTESERDEFELGPDARITSDDDLV